MAMQFSMTIEGHTLVVKASGCAGASQVQEYETAILELCRQSGVTHLLYDERHLVCQPGTIDVDRSPLQIAEVAPQVTRVAIVCDRTGAPDVAFWESAAVSHGPIVRTFRDMATAIHWLHHPEYVDTLPDVRYRPPEPGGAGARAAV